MIEPKLIIVGRIGTLPDGTWKGNMARMLEEECTRACIDFVRYEQAPFPDDAPANAVVVYLSGKEKFPAVLAECEKRRLTLLVVSSHVSFNDVPENVTTPVIVAPNLALLIQALLEGLARFCSLARLLGARFLLIEGHQKSKTSPPITMRGIADYCGIAHSDIVSIRDDRVAEALLGIPLENLGGYGKHIIIASLGKQRTLTEFETIGRVMYFHGLEVYLREINSRGSSLKPGRYLGQKFVFPPSQDVRALMDENVRLQLLGALT